MFKQLSMYNVYVRHVTKLCEHSRVKFTTRTNTSLQKLPTNDKETPPFRTPSIPSIYELISSDCNVRV